MQDARFMDICMRIFEKQWKFRQNSRQIPLLRKVHSKIACAMVLKKLENCLSLAMRIFDRSGHSRNYQADWRCCISIERKAGKVGLKEGLESIGDFFLFMFHFELEKA
eukprot:scaffold6751_cov172-Cylindrotheca_fusiformis.AAC.1